MVFMISHERRDRKPYKQRIGQQTTMGGPTKLQLQRFRDAAYDLSTGLTMQHSLASVSSLKVMWSGCLTCQVHGRQLVMNLNVDPQLETSNR